MCRVFSRNTSFCNPPSCWIARPRVGDDDGVYYRHHRPRTRKNQRMRAELLYHPSGTHICRNFSRYRKSTSGLYTKVYISGSQDIEGITSSTFLPSPFFLRLSSVFLCKFPTPCTNFPCPIRKLTFLSQALNHACVHVTNPVFLGSDTCFLRDSFFFHFFRVHRKFQLG